jgi:hypothetical protein
MSGAVEARSLASLTTLAANPPPDPRVSGQAHLEPLTLYIARVPGSRGMSIKIRHMSPTNEISDVFLTPLKPREKVVTAEDVQSSLYYLHFESPEDEGLLDDNSSGVHLANQLAELPGEGPSPWPAPLKPAPKQLPRVPAPAPPPAPTSAPPPDAASFQSRGLSAQNSVSRKPIAPPRLSPRPGVQSQHNIDANVPLRKPAPISNLPPTPPYPSDHSTFAKYSAPENFGPNGNTIVGSEQHHLSPNQAPPLPARPQSRPMSLPVHPRHLQPQASTIDGTSQRPSYAQQRSASDLTTGSSFNENFAITVIRRDPGSGEQWNVARITDMPIHHVSSSISNGEQLSPGRKEPGAPLYIDIGTPGYAKFLSPSEPTSPSPEQTYPFKRRLWMDSGRIPDSEQGHRKMRSNGSIEQPSTSSSGRKGLRGYTFLSPWNGRCEFSTGAGRGLKVRPNASNVTKKLLTSMMIVQTLYHSKPYSHLGERTPFQSPKHTSTPKCRTATCNRTATIEHDL